MPRIFVGTDKNPIVNVELFLETSTEEYIPVCLSRRDIFIIRSYLWPFVTWPTRLARPKGGSLWEQATDSEFQEFLDAYQSLEAKLGENYMGCLDGLLAVAAAIEKLAQAQTTCCQSSGNGSSGAGQGQPPISENTGGIPYEGDPPSGFDSWEEFFSIKCAVATDIVGTLIADVNRMTFLNLAGLTLLGLAAGLVPVLLSPIPFDDILVIAGILLGVIGFGGAILEDVKEILSDDASDFICALYSSSSAAQAEIDFEQMFSDKWDSGGYSSLTAISAKSLISSMVGPTVVNKLFDRDTTKTLPSGDCSSCGCQLAMDYGTGSLVPDNESRLLESTQNPGNGRYYIAFAAYDCKCSDGAFEVTVDSLSGYQINTSGTGTDPGDTASSYIDCSDVDHSLYAGGGWELGVPLQGWYFCLSGQTDPFSAYVTIRKVPL